MEKTRSPRIIGLVGPLAVFDESIYPFSALLVFVTILGLQNLPLPAGPWHNPVAILLWLTTAVLLELGLRFCRGPLQRRKLALKRRGVSFDKPSKSSMKAWSLEGLLSIANLIAFYALIFTASSGWKAVLVGLLCSLGLAGFCWLFLSLSDSWSKKGKRVTVVNALLFVVLMGVAFELVVLV
jgi:hypothetical protein